MSINLFPHFLEDAEQYELSERYWRDLWHRIAPAHREQFQWKSPWLGTGSPNIKDGNPIFSAYSPMLRRGIRVIQEDPIGSEPNIQAWLDTFGDAADPDRIDELAISCTLSDASASLARRLMEPWICGQAPSFESDQHWPSTSAG